MAQINFYLILIFQVGIIENIRYDGHQLWRISDFSKQAYQEVKHKIINYFETQFDGLLWTDTGNYFDISIDRIYNKSVEILIKKYNLNGKILIEDVQRIVNDQNKFTTEERDEIDWQSYQDLRTINKFLKTMEKFYPDKAKVFEIGRTDEGRVLKVLRISNNPKSYDRIWVDGGIHAREWITTAAVTYIIHSMLSNWNTLPYHMKTITWFFAPVLNPDGYEYSWKFDRLWHKNRRKNFLHSNKSEECRGVDLNHNFNINWKSGDQIIQPCHINYAGHEIFSEAETQCVRDFINHRRIDMKGYLSFRSYGQAIIYPYAFTDRITNEIRILKIEALKIAKKIQELHNITYKVKPGFKPYFKSGTFIDWAYVVLKIPYSYEIELSDRSNYGYLIPENQITSVGKEALDIITLFSEMIYEN